MLRIIVSLAAAATVGCASGDGLQSFYILKKDASQIELVQVQARGVPTMGEPDLRELAKLHCVGPVALAGTRRLDASRGGYKVFQYRCA